MGVVTLYKIIKNDAITNTKGGPAKHKHAAFVPNQSSLPEHRAAEMKVWLFCFLFFYHATVQTQGHIYLSCTLESSLDCLFFYMDKKKAI